MHAFARLPGFCVGGCGTYLTHTDKSEVVNLETISEIERTRLGSVFLKRSVPCECAEGYGGSVSEQGTMF